MINASTSSDCRIVRPCQPSTVNRSQLLVPRQILTIFQQVLEKVVINPLLHRRVPGTQRVRILVAEVMALAAGLEVQQARDRVRRVGALVRGPVEAGRAFGVAILLKVG